jgi:hypothetical protein
MAAGRGAAFAFAIGWLGGWRPPLPFCFGTRRGAGARAKGRLARCVGAVGNQKATMSYVQPRESEDLRSCHSKSTPFFAAYSEFQRLTACSFSPVCSLSSGECGGVHGLLGSSSAVYNQCTCGICSSGFHEGPKNGDPLNAYLVANGTPIHNLGHSPIVLEL